ncbi:energy transducer TonB [Prevotella sp. OH937_COT-195]|uniref:energy transducer TonB n=1 Tax=Prevotella sp. OH937_COT-195 TaxID=2491051 RepID=UPI000F651ED2|nr:energy transducer TonB [Prevotella sp. OH937_COT-195]RRD02085.1 energy transducer TonB [Prevotella sp. OH937_COT-195]
MAKIDLYDPKWVDMVFADKNKAYGAYVIRKETSGRNIKALVILIVVALLVGGGLAYKVHQNKVDAEHQAYLEQLELQKLQEAAKKEKKEEIKVQPKVEPKKEIPEVRESQKFTAPVIKKDDLVKEENTLKAMDDLEKDVAVSNVDQEGTKDRTMEAIRNDIKVEPEPTVEVQQKVAIKVFDVVEQMPSFPGGQSALMQYLANNIKYPTLAEENGVQGRVIVQFVVSKDGSISNVRVVKSVDPSLDKEAARVVNSMPKWIPGKQNGQEVNVKYTVPVTFKLQ